MDDYKKLFSLLRPYSFKLTIAIFLNILYVIFSIVSISLLAPFLSLLFNQIPLTLQKPMLDFTSAALMQYAQYYLSQIIISKGLFSALSILILSVFVFFLLKNVFYYFSMWVIIPVRNNLIRDLRNKAYPRILILPLSFYSENRKGDILTRVINDVQDVDFFILRSLQQVFREPISILFFLGTLFFINFEFTFLVLFTIPIAGFVISRLQRKLKQKSLKVKEKQSEMLSMTEESIYGLRIIKAFNAIPGMMKRFITLNDSYSKLLIKINRRRDLSSPMSEFLGSCIVIFILLFGGRMVLDDNNSFSAEMFITYIVLFTQIINPAKTISEATANFKKGFASLHRIETLIQSEEKILELPNAQSISTFTTNISFKNVHFAYEDKTILNNISLVDRKSVV